MIEVFKTTVNNSYFAKLLVTKIAGTLPGSKVNFDLSDCDRVLRVEYMSWFDTGLVIEIVKIFGYQAEVMSDEIPVAGTNQSIRRLAV